MIGHNLYWLKLQLWIDLFVLHNLPYLWVASKKNFDNKFNTTQTHCPHMYAHSHSRSSWYYDCTSISWLVSLLVTHFISIYFYLLSNLFDLIIFWYHLVLYVKCYGVWLLSFFRWHLIFDVNIMLTLWALRFPESLDHLLESKISSISPPMHYDCG